MKPAYQNIIQKTGAHSAGISKIEIAACHWLQLPVILDLKTGTVDVPVSLSKPLLEFNFTQKSIKYAEKPKNTKAGTFYEITIQGLGNTIDKDLLRVIETIRFDNLIVIITDCDSKRIIGNESQGMVLQASAENNSNANVLGYDIVFSSPYPPPFYLP